jgi:hypothetical protein
LIDYSLFIIHYSLFIIHYSLLLMDDYANFYIQNLIYFMLKGLFPIEVFYPGDADIINHLENINDHISEISLA